MIRSAPRDLTLAALVTLTIVGVVSFGPLPDASRLSAESHDFAHVIVFAILGLVLARTLHRLPTSTPGWPPVALATLAAGLGLGVLTEVAQSYVGGILSRGDVARDTLGSALGICAAIALDRPIGRGTRRLLGVAVVTGLVAAALPLADALLDYRARAAMFPVLLDPEAPRGLAFADAFGRTVTLETLPQEWQAARGGGTERALLVRVDSGRWPGLTLSEPEPDWRGWRLLVLELVNPGDAPLKLALRVNDRAHDNAYDDRYNVTFELPPRSRRQFEFPLEQIERAPRTRRMSLDRISRLVVFHDGLAPGRSFYVRAIWLVR
jgi:VanZ family protein